MMDSIGKSVAENDAEIERLRAREDRLLRRTIDYVWGVAMEDGSVPSTTIQDAIIQTVRSAVDEQEAPQK